MYQVLYRKWRPKTFSDVVGQPQVTVTLKNELKSNKIAHAYLFTGSRGTGKTSCAKILSKAINCPNLRDGDPCNECEMCKNIESGAILDVVEIDAASNNGVENIRNLKEEATFTPASAKYRVYIIDEVHMLSIGAFNALLKTLEEPPKHVVFILATTEVHKLPATILSRCQRFDFHRIDPNSIADRLKFVSQHENATIEDDAALLISHISDGALRDSLSLLDQCLVKSKNVTSEVVANVAGLAGYDHIIKLSDSILKKDCARSLSIINDLHNSSKDMIRLCDELISHFRSLMLFKTMNDPRNLIVVSVDYYEEIRKQSENTSIEFIINAMDCLQSAAERMLKGVNKRVELELAVIKMSSDEREHFNRSIIDRVSKLEKEIKTKLLSLPQIKESLPSQNKKDNAPDETNKKSDTNVDLEELQKNAKPFKEWHKVLDELKSYSKTIATAFNDSKAYISHNYVLIDSPNLVAFELLRKSAQRDKMRIAIQNITGTVYKLGPYKSKKVPESNAGDSLDDLAALAKESGIEVTQN